MDIKQSMLQDFCSYNHGTIHLKDSFRMFLYTWNPSTQKPKDVSSNSGYSCLCEASGGESDLLLLLPRLGLSATATPEELKRLGAEKMVQIGIRWCIFFFTPILGEMIQIDEPIFQMGCILLQCSLEGFHMQSLHGSGMGPWLI